ncbi:uncharacterized protein LOC127857635 isoform X6 [Dreissena polymorpha]|uniref:uncharacterized protein LOC127857635 isoform X6 n=1 Tax=Dreissena polymorpha TaxID=45954 RepID=UPI00226400DD|nr:uncharacterized protein LOC127857635 isoform X6 [Dreissena polymorpha]
MENVNKRAKAFNEREIEVMTDYMKLNIHKLRMNHGSGGPGMVARVREIWDELLAGVNACGNGPRTLQQIMEKWRNMTQNAKADVSKERNLAATGGGPPLTEMSQTSQAVASLFAHSASFHGVVDDADSVIAVTPPSPRFLGLPIMELLTTTSRTSRIPSVWLKPFQTIRRDAREARKNQAQHLFHQPQPQPNCPVTVAERALSKMPS